MSQANLKIEKNRPLDPNVLQRQASAPDTSVWVGASAGSGKTKVLTDRMLRLLLPSADGVEGAPPNKILALTFTKAAASEMAIRINKRLSEWAAMPLDAEKNLTGDLKNLLGHEPTEKQLAEAQKLFAKVVDTPGGLKIMTIHSFCQSILGRFPLEAGLTPGFKVLEETQAQQYLASARDKVLRTSIADKATPLAEAVNNLAGIQNEDQFILLLQGLMSERRQMQNILTKHFDINGFYTALCQSLDIPAGKSPEEMLVEACADNAFDEAGLRRACKALAESSKVTDQGKADKIQNWLDADERQKITLYDEYKSAFLKQDGDIYAKLATKEAQDSLPDILDILGIEAQRLIDVQNNLSAAETAILTRDLFLIGAEILEIYAEAKNKENALDFDDLILRTLDLLQGRTVTKENLDIAPWVRYKLDQGIDHILVDEAQDTNPEQWEIVKALSDDFFDNVEAEETRTLFVVGDEKQSIFSFQRASPEKFSEMHDYFSNKISAAQKKFQSVDFNTSFRSVKSVLQFVDSVFENDLMRQGLGRAAIQHEAFRYTQPGLVELWPLFTNPEKQTYDPWEPPVQVIESSSGAAAMAAHIGKTIAGWIDNKEMLESYGRSVQAGDILILVRSRTAFVDQLVRALKTNNVPVSGVDRMVLSKQLAVQDLCAAAEFALLPEDDLTLASILKSPFIGWDEEQLYDAAYDRKTSLWESVKNKADESVTAWLSKLIQRGGSQKPYEFFAQILQEPCPADEQTGLRALKKRLGDDCLDPIDEFLNFALDFDQDAIPTLQNFLHVQQHQEVQVKRQMEETGNAVRIMTVHGAKGLQAPIVILPDTVKGATGGKIDRILWPDRSGSELPYFCPTSKSVPQKCEDAFGVLKQRQEEESKRLLYVALTRAESRLYIGGYAASEKISDDSWYKYAKNAFDTLDAVERIPLNDQEILRLSNPDTAGKPDKTEGSKNSLAANDIKAPEWLFEKMPQEPKSPKPLIPSRPSQDDSAALSPLRSQENSRFMRGNVTHKLLQILPDIPIEKRKEAAVKYTALPAHNLSKEVQESIVTETLAVLNHPDFAPIFGAGSLAEVPVTGLLDDGTLISGQIDRLLITDNEILIIDYKTNRPAPKTPENIPVIYRNQMHAYAGALKKIYKNKDVRTALIWTDGAQLMEIPA